MTTIFNELETRRQKLGMSRQMLARRSGVSPATVVRILSGKHPTASFQSVAAIAGALGMRLRFDSEAGPEEFRERQAQRKAGLLMKLLQGTSGLEGQALDATTLQEMTQRTAHELLAGSRFKLWSE